MNEFMRRTVLLAGVLVLCVAPIFAQSARTAGNAASADRLASRSKLRAASTPTLSSSSWEIWYNLIIPPGDVFILDSKLDYSQCDTVRVTVRSANSDIPSLRLTAYWAVPEAQMFNTAETVTGDHFFYNNVGGALFNTYGTQFRLELANTGSSTMTITQVIILARAY